MCKFKCCRTCTFCKRAIAKERYKSRYCTNLQREIKVCEKCFFCHSLVLCSTCKKCQKCCSNSNCRGQASELLANLVGSGYGSEGGSDPKRGLHSSLSDPTKTSKIPHSHKPLCRSSQEQLPVRGIASAYGQKCSGTSAKPGLPRVLQPTIFSPKTKQQVEAHPGLEQTKSFSQGGEIQDGNTGNHQDLPSDRGVGHLYRLQGRLLPHSYTGTVQEIPKISCPGSNIPIQGSALWSVHGTLGIYSSSKRSETDGPLQGYKDPPVPRRLVGESHIPPGLSPAYPVVSPDLSGPRLAGKFREIRTGTQTGLRLCRLSVRPSVRSGPTHIRTLAEPPAESTGTVNPTDLSGPGVHVPNRVANSHRKASSSGTSPHETNSVAFEKPLESTRISGENYSSSQVPAPSSTMVVGRRKRTHRSTTTPSETCSANFYRRIKRRVGRSLRRAHCKRNLVLARKQTAYKLPRTEGSFSSLKRVPKALLQQYCSDSYRQHHSGVIHKQGRRHEIGHTLCPTVEDPDLVYQKSSHPQGPTHSRPTECGSGQAIQARSDHSDGMVPPSRGISNNLLQVAPASDRPFCHKVQQQTTSVCVSSTGLHGHCSGFPQFAMGGSGCLCLPTNSSVEQSGGEVAGLPLQEHHPDRSGVAQHALVLGSGVHVQPDTLKSAISAQTLDSALQSDSTQKPVTPQSSCLAPRATTIKEQGFSEAVAARIEAPQRQSTRSVYEAKWTIFTKWCITNQVDFRAPPVKSVADFLMYLFQDRKLQPSTIDGYRSAIADKLGNSSSNISKDENLTRLLDSFHRDRPKGRRGIPSWNLSLVLHQLTKAPFEPLKEASLKHLTFKTVFLLALGSGKRRSEIHAWQNKNIRHQADWSKVSLYPSPSFLSKNQLAKEGPESVAPVVIPALAPTLDRSLKSDRSLCPVRALRYYLDRTSDLRQNKELVFISFKKGFDKDISPATISSWIKQTVILCYELSDQESNTLHQVKAHDVRAFAASKAFQSGVSLEQILLACHWKSHNTFTQFYLKDVAWADSELFHLGPVVAAQQIHQQAST